MNTLSKSSMRLHNLALVMFISLLSLFILNSCAEPDEEKDNSGETQAGLLLTPSALLAERYVGENATFIITVKNTGSLPLVFVSGNYSLDEYFQDPRPGHENDNKTNIYSKKEMFTIDSDNTTCKEGETITRSGCNLVVKFDLSGATNDDVGQLIRVKLYVRAKSSTADNGGGEVDKSVKFYGEVLKGTVAKIEVAKNLNIKQSDGYSNYILVKSTGDKNLILNSFEIDNTTDNHTCFKLEAVNDNDSSLPIACDNSTLMRENQKCAIKVTFTPPKNADGNLKAGNYTAKLSIKSNASGKDSEKTVELTATVIGGVMTEPKDGEILDFGTVNKVAGSTTAELLITNYDNVEKTISYNPPTNFSIPEEPDKSCKTLAAHTSCILLITYTVPAVVPPVNPPAPEVTPFAEADENLPTLTVTVDSKVVSTIKLQVTPGEDTPATLTPNPVEGLKFVQFENKPSHTQTTTLKATGDVTIKTIKVLDNLESSEFTIDNTTCKEKLTPGDSCGIDIKFETAKVSDNRSFTDYLQIVSSAGTKLVNLKATAIPNTYSVANGTPEYIPISFGDNSIDFNGETSEKVIHLVNDNTPDITIKDLSDEHKKHIDIVNSCSGTITNNGEKCTITIKLSKKSPLNWEKEVVKLTERITLLITAKVYAPTFLADKIYVNGNSIFAIDSSGTLYAWGDNQYWLTGTEDLKVGDDGKPVINPKDVTAPNKITKRVDDGGGELPKLSSLFFGNETYMIGVSDNKTFIFAWGDSKYNQTGTIAGLPISESFSPIGITKLGNLRSDTPPQVKTIVSGESGFTLLIDSNNLIYSWGRNNTGQAGEAADNDKIVGPIGKFTDPNIPIKSVVTAGDTVFAITQDSVTYAWGNNKKGQTGLKTDDNPIRTPTELKLTPFNDKFKNIYPADDGSVIGTVIGGSILYAWGNNDNGQLGVKNSGTDTTIKTPTGISIPLSTYEIADIQSGEGFKIALTADGKVVGWGNNTHNVIDGSADPTVLPKTIPMPNNATIKSIYVVKDHVFALSTSGVLFAWGNTDTNQLGISNTGDPEKPTEILTNVKAVYAMPKHTFAIKTDNKLFAWGAENLGTKEKLPLSPKQVIMPDDKIGVLAVYPGTNFTIFLGTDNMIYSVGSNEKGQLGIGSDNVSPKEYVQSIFDASMNKAANARRAKNMTK